MILIVFLHIKVTHLKLLPVAAAWQGRRRGRRRRRRDWLVAVPLVVVVVVVRVDARVGRNVGGAAGVLQTKCNALQFNSVSCRVIESLECPHMQFMGKLQDRGNK